MRHGRLNKGKKKYTFQINASNNPFSALKICYLESFEDMFDFKTQFYEYFLYTYIFKIFPAVVKNEIFLQQAAGGGTEQFGFLEGQFQICYTHPFVLSLLLFKQCRLKVNVILANFFIKK